MNIAIPLRAWFLVGLLVGVGEFSKAQTENPVQKGHTVVEEPVPVSNTRGEIVPLFWKASIDQSVVMFQRFGHSRLRLLDFTGISFHFTHNKRWY